MKAEVASRRIESFGQRFGEAHLYFAYHAAFPLALTPDLLYRLWANFQRDIHRQELKIPWLAVADLLLSSLCDEVGHELYEIDTAVRNMLLRELKENPRFGEQRINELSDFLLTYVRQQLESHDPDIRDFAQAQKWTALAYTRPSEAAHELASILGGLKLEEKAEWVRMTSLVETFAEPLAEFQPLLIYARGMANFVRGKQERAITQITGLLANQEPQLNIAGVNLLIPKEIATFIEEPSYIIEPKTNITSSQKSTTCRILVVDDVPDNLLLIHTILEGEGYEINLAPDGITALAQVEQSSPDLIILDVKMPEIDGYEVTRRIRNNHNLPYIPILLISAFVESNVVEGLDTGADDFIRKPIDVDELLARVRSLLRLKGMIDRRKRIDSNFNQSSLENFSNFSSVLPFNNQSKETELNVRIYELAKELNVDNQHILAICKSLGIEVTSHLNKISTLDVQRIHAAFRDYTTSVPPFNNQSKETELNVRIYELAKELNVDNQSVLAICKSLGIEVASHLNMISTSDVQRIRAAFRDYTTSVPYFDFGSEFITKAETLKDEIISHKTLNSARLHDLLAVGRWQEADQETEQLIIQIADAERQSLLGVEEIKNLSCDDLRVIDRLWVEYSNGHFGFSVQKKIWESLGFTNNIRDYNIWWNFGNSVGWRVKDRWLPYERIKFTFQAPQGHLPFFRAWIGMRQTGLVYSMHQVNRFHAFMYRCESCNLTQ